MNNIIKSAITVSVAAAALVLPISAHAAIHSQSKELVVEEPQDLPEQAQITGCSLLLHSDSTGSTYLYVEQQQGRRLTVFDVTDPSHIKVEDSTRMPDEGPFDFVRPLGDNAELVYFRDGQKTGVLDLRNANKPELRTVDNPTDLADAEPLGESGLLATDVSYRYIPATARDYQVIDISAASPTTLATVKNVTQQATNDETGTTFLLGSDGLTVVRQISVENEYKIGQDQMRGN